MHSRVQWIIRVALDRRGRQYFRCTWLGIQLHRQRAARIGWVDASSSSRRPDNGSRPLPSSCTRRSAPRARPSARSPTAPASSATRSTPISLTSTRFTVPALSTGSASPACQDPMIGQRSRTRLTACALGSPSSSPGIGRTSGCSATSLPRWIRQRRRKPSRISSSSGWRACRTRSPAGGPWWTRGARPRLHAVLSHATAFGTWRSLTGGGLTDEQAVDLLAAMVSGIASGSIVVRDQRRPARPPSAQAAVP